MDAAVESLELEAPSLVEVVDDPPSPDPPPLDPLSLDPLSRDPLSREPPSREPPSPPFEDPDDPSLPDEALGALVARRSFFAQPEPLKWMVGALKAFFTGPLPHTGQVVGGSAWTPWTTSKRVPQAAQS